jgi:hypothetical protein
MSQSILAVSAAPRSLKWLAQTGRARILNLFENSINLFNDGQDVLSIVVPGVGNGPFNVVIDAEQIPSQIEISDQISIGEKKLNIGDVVVDLSRVRIWDPVPHWGAFADSHAAELIHSIEGQLKLSNTPEGMAGVFYSGSADRPSKFCSKLKSGSTLLVEGLRQSDVERIMAGADTLGGLGPGLTPSGDDFLIGTMHGLWATREGEKAKQTAELIWAGAAGGTTAFSRAWLAAAVAGEAVESWHTLIKAASSTEGHRIEQAIKAILSIGETSGADALTGFVQVLKFGWAK